MSAPGNGRKGLYGLNVTCKQFPFNLMETVKLPGSKGYDTHMVTKSETSTADASLSKEFQKNLSNAAQKHGLIDQGKYKNWHVQNFGQKGGIT